MGLDLQRVVFTPVLERMKRRADSLRNVKRFNRSGIEGWFKVEVVATLGERVVAICNKGPDLLFNDGTRLELKAATDFNRKYLLEPVTKYCAPCLFLGDGSGNKSFPTSDHDDFEVIGCEFFSDGAGQWIVGLVSPRQSQDPIARTRTRAVYAVKLGAPVRVIHVFKKKSGTGIKTPRRDIELIRRRLGRLQEDR